MIYDSVLTTTNNDLCLWHGTMYIRTSSSYEKPFMKLSFNISMQKVAVFYFYQSYLIN